MNDTDKYGPFKEIETHFLSDITLNIVWLMNMDQHIKIIWKKETIWWNNDNHKFNDTK